MRRTRAMLAAALVAVIVAAAPFSAAPVSAAPASQTDSAAARPTVDSSVALAQLKGEPLATAAKTKPPKGKKIDFSSNTVKAYRAQLSALRNDFKKWLAANAPKAKVTGAWDISLNAVTIQLNGTTLAKIRTAPQVVRAEHGGLYYPTIDDPDLALIGALEGWAAVGGPAEAGAGVKVAVIDSGIDVDHPCFDDTGYAPQTQLGDRRFTNDKVIAAKVFYNRARNQNLTPEAIDSHGTHVAGTVACNYQTPAAVSGVHIPYGPSGVAPAALLGNYNVFPGRLESARSEDILNAMEAAYTDGFDVANMSLGGGASGIQDLLTIAVDNLDRANMVVAVSAGNSGPGHYTVGSPGSAARALTAGGSTVGHYVAAPVTVDGVAYGAVASDFPVVEGAPLAAPLHAVTTAPVNATSGLNEACAPLPAGSLSGTIALIARGTCDFSTKIRYAELAGASAVLVANRIPGDPTAMGQGASPDGVQPTVPAYMVSLTDALVLTTKHGMGATISPDLAYFLSGNDDIQYESSSQGPTDVDFRVKPDVVAPAVNVLSSIPGDDCGATGCWAFFSGTSMAAPHLAGAAAVIRGHHPTWTAEQIRSAIVNTAKRGAITTFDSAALVTDVNIIGTGQLDLGSAVAAKAALAPVSTSFGSVPSGSGQTRSQAVVISNLTGAPVSWSLGIADTVGAGMTFSVSPASVSLGAGASTAVTVTMTAVKGAARGDHQAMLTVSSSAGTLLAHAVVYAFVK